MNGEVIEMKTRRMYFGILLIVVIAIVTCIPAGKTAAQGRLNGIKVCLDPGHGGIDPGAVNDAYELHESEINLDVAFGLQMLLEGSGAQVVLTRTDDSFLENYDRYTFCNAETATILVSIHTNSVIYPEWDGAMALYFRPHEDDKRLAGAIYEVMYPFLQETAPDPVAFRSFGLDWFASGVLLRSDMPAAMMEPLLMSNPAEAELLVTRIYPDSLAEDLNTDCRDFGCRRGQIAQAIFNGILNYFTGPQAKKGLAN
jgi:N-acetylmuramoyl-L-alanine amidase